MDKQENNMILTKRDDELKEQHHNASGTKEQKLDCWDKGTEKKMESSATNEHGKHPCKEELNGVVGKSTTKSTSLQWAYGKHLKIMR